ncbi:hypothetical protein LCGC14_2452490 [marine sediment metagenome]|uniref:Uncharacterized protein n=1 Tax=marine sediment metagenome TaxID=412755 RepID=A0A0F9BG65_9ZZZZ
MRKWITERLERYIQDLEREIQRIQLERLRRILGPMFSEDD